MKKTRIRLLLVLFAVFMAVALIAWRASSQYYPQGYIYRCGGTGFLHVTKEVEDSNCKAVNLASTADVIGTLPPSKGGTGAATFPAPGTSGNSLISNGTVWTSAALLPAPGLTGSVLTSNGSVWISSPVAASPTVTISG